MMKSILLAGGMMMAAPVFAQTAPVAGQAAPTTTTTAPATAVPQASTAPATPPAGTADTTVAQTEPAAGAATAPPDQSQVAQVVDQQFATYDKDANGALSKTEFAAWMTALKASTPAATTETAAQKTAWNDAAFKQADSDKSATVTKTELTSFLVKGSSGAS